MRQPIPRTDSVPYLPPAVRVHRRALLLALYSLESQMIAGRDSSTALQLHSLVDDIRAAVETLLKTYTSGRTTPPRVEVTEALR
jgi:hypothetical protein